MTRTFLNPFEKEIEQDILIQTYLSNTSYKIQELLEYNRDFILANKSIQDKNKISFKDTHFIELLEDDIVEQFAKCFRLLKSNNRLRKYNLHFTVTPKSTKSKGTDTK